ncbi:MAG: efflux RND transporter periplasmic adaptor subunit, partial [Phycisphaerae bacterium]
MSRKKRYPVFLFSAVLAAAAIAGAGVVIRARVGRGTAAAAPDKAEAAATPVRVTRIERRPITVTADFHGFLAPFEELTVAAQVSGEIVRQWVDVSDAVTAGDPLFKTDAAAREIEHEQALADQDRAASEYELAEANLERLQALPDDSSQPMELIDSAARFRKAKAGRRRAAATVRMAALLLERTTVRSPIDGVISRVYLRRGEFAQQGQPLVDVIEIDRLKLMAEIDDRAVVWATVGQPVSVTTKTFPNERFRGRIHRIYPKALPTSHKFEVEIELPNPRHHLRPGFFMTGTITRAPDTESATADAAPRGIVVIPRG